MNKVIIDFNNHKVEFYNLPYALARAIEIILHHIEMDSDVEIPKDTELKKQKKRLLMNL